jgi:hypothetical protein
MTLTKADYRAYITSPDWRGKHKGFLKRSRYRCAFLPFLSLKKRYNCHHMNYDRLGEEVLWEDVICLHPWIHRWIVHGILSGFKRPSQQKKYPNKFQQTFHFWCTLPHSIRLVLMIAIIVNVVKILMTS